MEKTFICSREKYLELKARQINIASSGKQLNKDYKDYIKARREYYHSKGRTIPLMWVYSHGEYVDNDKKYGFEYKRRDDIPRYDEHEARYFNVIYALIKGKAYNKVEQKVHEGNELQQFYVKKYCDKYGVDYNTIKGLIWQTS